LVLKNPEDGTQIHVTVDKVEPAQFHPKPERPKPAAIAKARPEPRPESKVASNPEDDLYQRAMLATREKDDDETARVLLQDVLKQDPNHIAAADELYAIYERAENFEGALAALQKLERDSEQSERSGIDYGLGRLYLEFGHPDEARTRLERALESGGDNPLVREQLAAAYMNLGEKELARREWQTLAQDPAAGRASVNAKARLAEVLFAEGRQAEADHYIMEVLQQDPQHRLGVLLSGR
jgi:Tfp pilus assembly protein PilF